MKTFELWLDESGDFTSDHKTHLNPSLAGGILIEKNFIEDQLARKILGKKYVHFNEEKPEYLLEVLSSTKYHNATFVIFQNIERIHIIDSDTTYLNILSEGIIKLYLKLSALYGDFRLEILIATRKKMSEGAGIIQKSEYENRLREKIIISLAKKKLTRKNNWSYSIHFDDARLSTKLMIADGVCNAYLTRTSNKFSPEQKEIIEQIYDADYVFSLYDNVPEIEVQRQLAEENIGSAIVTLYFEKEIPDKDKYVNLAIGRLKEFNSQGISIHLNSIIAQITILMKVHKAYDFLETILEELQSDFIPKLKSNGIKNISTFCMDISLFLYTIFTHKGSSRAMGQDKVFQAELACNQDIMTIFDYYCMYMLRRSIHNINMLDPNTVIEDISDLIETLEGLGALLPDLVTLSSDDNKPKFSALGKAYGTRGQAYSMLIHKDENYIHNARSDYFKAIENFSLDNDIERQYIYLSSAECEAGNFLQALQYLGNAIQNSIVLEMSDFDKFLGFLGQKPRKSTIYLYKQYIKIMAFSKRCGDSKLADGMYKSLVKNIGNVERFKNEYPNPHPLQYIFWFMGSYFTDDGKIKKAQEFFNLAIEKCEISDETTMKIVQLGIYADNTLALINNVNGRDAKNKMEQFVNLFKQIQHENHNLSMYNINVLTSEVKDIGSHENTLKDIIAMTKCM